MLKDITGDHFLLLLLIECLSPTSSLNTFSYLQEEDELIPNSPRQNVESQNLVPPKNPLRQSSHSNSTPSRRGRTFTQLQQQGFASR